jgi:glycosyltransferase involved in cell wall biosynthesis
VDQTYDDIEMIVVDDGSPTPVEEELSLSLSSSSRSTVQFIRHEENQGANAARNTGIRAATGEYVAFLDDDDEWVETKVERQVSTFEEATPETGVVYTGIREESPSGTTVKTPSREGNVVKALLAGANFGQFSSLMVRADVIDAAGLPDERFPIWQDREWYFRLAQHAEFRSVAEPLTVRTVGHEDQISHDFEAKCEVAYPLFLEKHRSLAVEHGWRYERLFLASLRFSLAKTAVRCQQYREARKYFLLAFLSYPTYQRCFVMVLVTLGGGASYGLARAVNRKITKLHETFQGTVP